MKPFLLITLLLVSTLSFGQVGDGRIQVQLDKPSIRIGEQATLSIHGNADGPIIEWPTFPDTLSGRIEVLQVGELDTIPGDGQYGGTGDLVRRELKLTAFDTGYWAIPPLSFRIDGRTVETEALLLHVQGERLDSAAVPRDIGPIVELPFSLVWWARQHWTWLVGGAGTLLAVLALLLFLTRIKKPRPSALPEPTPLPLHERTLAQLELLSQQRLWQNGDHKGYQSALTDILRSYIEERYRVPALERTTDELLHELRVSPLTTEQQGLLANVLRLADMVKFAKALPSPQENEQMMTVAVRFVRETATTGTHASQP